MRTADFDYSLPPELIAQSPAPERDQSRLMILERSNGGITNKAFPDLLDHLQPGDLMVFNDSRVIPARLRGRNAQSGGAFEMLLLEEVSRNRWWSMVRPGKRARVQARIDVLDLQKQPTRIQAIVEDTNADGHRLLRFEGTDDLLGELERLGEIPLPPYIERATQDPADRERYQTVYAKAAGSVAAPTAGLHFTQELLSKIRAKGVKTCFVTLHVGPGTFAPVKADSLSEHIMHEERFFITKETAAAIREAKSTPGQRVIGVGTTTLRVLESVAQQNAGQIVEGSGRTKIFIYPPFDFKVVDAMVTNFHLPCSTLLMLVSAFAAPGEVRGREMMLSAYAEAVRERYRFFSYGDAMLIE
jgi:S-adenosylmethionine:tRNA ribosyltransferase-isomerase